MRKLWNDPGRGKVPMGWTVSPAMLDAMPGALDYYWKSASAGDVLVSGPSGWGYGYPNVWKSADALARYVAASDDYALRAGLRVVSVWNTITGGIDPGTGTSYAENAPSLLGLSAQNTGGGLTIYDGKLPGFALSCNYCTNEQAIKDFVGSAAQGWDGREPRFILIQAQPWQGVTPTTFANVRDGLPAGDVVVRPDSWFQLLRQANHLRLEPHAPIADGTYRLVSEASGKCVALSAGKIEQLACADDDAQRWRVAGTDAGYARLTSRADGTTLLNIEGGGAGDGPPAIGGHDDQQWQAVWEAGADYHLIARASDRCLDVPNGTSADAQLRQWGCNGAPAQAFRFADPAWPPPGDAGADAPRADGGVDAATPIDAPRNDVGVAETPAAADAGGSIADAATSTGAAGSGPTPAHGKPAAPRGGCAYAPSPAPAAWLVAISGLLVLSARSRRRLP